MGDWKDEIAGCFGAGDLAFAIHPLDEGRAFELLKRLRRDTVGWAEASGAVRSFLQGKGCSAQHIDRQMDRVESHLRPWLLD